MTTRTATLRLTSPAIHPDGRIPVLHTCDEGDQSPPLSWTGAPEGTESFVLFMEDPDAPAGLWIHWVLYDVPGSATGLPADLPKEPRLPDGSTHGLCWGVDSFERIGYQGPCPPPGPAHRYHFVLYALRERLGLPPRRTKDQVMAAMKGKVLGRAELVAKYKRHA